MVDKAVHGARKIGLRMRSHHKRSTVVMAGRDDRGSAIRQFHGTKSRAALKWDCVGHHAWEVLHPLFGPRMGCLHIRSPLGKNRKYDRERATHYWESHDSDSQLGTTPVVSGARMLKEHTHGFRVLTGSQ